MGTEPSTHSNSQAKPRLGPTMNQPKRPSKMHQQRKGAAPPGQGGGGPTSLEPSLDDAWARLLQLQRPPSRLLPPAAVRGRLTGGGRHAAGIYTGVGVPPLSILLPPPHLPHLPRIARRRRPPPQIARRRRPPPLIARRRCPPPQIARRRRPPPPVGPPGYPWPPFSAVLALAVAALAALRGGRGAPPCSRPRPRQQPPSSTPTPTPTGRSAFSTFLDNGDGEPERSGSGRHQIL